MRKNLKFLLRIQSARLGRELINPANFLVELTGSICYFFLHLFSFTLIIRKFSFPGWSTGEMWIMLFTFQIFTYTAFFLFWKGLIHTVRDINRGAFDYLLTKPISTRLITFFRSGGLHNLVCAALGFLGVFTATIIFRIEIEPISVMLYISLLGISLWIFHSITVILISLNFFFGYLPATSSAAFQVQEIYKYPSTIFSRSGIWAWLSVLPFSFLTTIPAASFLTKRLDGIYILGYILLYIFSRIISGLIWKYSLSHYSSSGS